MRCDVARVFRRVVHAHDLARFGGSAGDPFSERDVVDVHALVVAQAEEVAQGAGAAVDVENAEGVVIDQLADGAGDLAREAR